MIIDVFYIEDEYGRTLLDVFIISIFDIILLLCFSDNSWSTPQSYPFLTAEEILVKMVGSGTVALGSKIYGNGINMKRRNEKRVYRISLKEEARRESWTPNWYFSV